MVDGGTLATMMASRGDAPAKSGAARRITQHGQRARADVVSHGGDGGVVAVVEKRGDASWWPVSDSGELGAAAVAKEKLENENGERGE